MSANSKIDRTELDRLPRWKVRPDEPGWYVTRQVHPEPIGIRWDLELIVGDPLQYESEPNEAWFGPINYNEKDVFGSGWPSISKRLAAAEKLVEAAKSLDGQTHFLAAIAQTLAEYDPAWNGNTYKPYFCKAVIPLFESLRAALAEWEGL